VELPGAWLLLSPAGLLGVLALAIPIAIHLISRGRGRRVLIGNIELVRAARQAQVTTPRLTEWLLLLLRVLIVIVATLLLAELARQGLGSVNDDVSYVTPGWLRAAPESERNQLLSRGPAARVLVEGYPQADEFAAAANDLEYDAWPLLAERLSTLRHPGAVEVFAENRMHAFGERRPALPNELKWQLAITTDAPAIFDSHGLVVYDRDRAALLRQLELALEALQRHRVPGLTWTTCKSDETSCRDEEPDWIAWLSATRAPDDLDGPRVYRPDFAQWRQAVADPRYPESLVGTVLSSEQQRLAWQRIPVSIGILDAGAESAASAPMPYRPLDRWLGLLLIALWAAERLLSEYRRTGNA
jgi:hypothetical protein